MLLGLLTLSFAIVSPDEGFEAKVLVGEEVLMSREARGLVGEGRGDAEDIVDGMGVLVVGSGLDLAWLVGGTDRFSMEL